MYKTTPLCLMLLSLILTLPGCGVLFPEPPEKVVLTKLQTVDHPILMDTSCPPEPTPPPKPQGHNTLAKDAATYWNEYAGWGMACRDINDAITAILRPSKEELKPAVN